ncbi:PREDICTED: reticulon-1 isoform X2 [Nicrophorus vespilloides]|uniref:Reticulon-like protein n=1 Tax=Nicrophorus vespilloides TaxID=110193 RepID=A0ABM1MC81_NICVS|nr:PREDICTED: reticulon-1 isoform X2 [Nicrophorus vespilloides]
MEAKDLLMEKEGGMKREMDSVDDFEHLERISPVNARDIEGIINKGVATASDAANDIADVLSTFDPLQTQEVSPKMDSNLLEMGDAFPDRKEADAKLDKFLNEMSTYNNPTPPKKDDNQDLILSSQNFMDHERQQPMHLVHDDLLEHYSDSDPEDDFKHAESDDFRKSQELPEISSKDTFKDFVDLEPPKQKEPEQEPVKTKEPEPIQVEEPKQEVITKIEPTKVEPPKIEPPKVEPPKVEPPKVEPPKAEPPKIEQPKIEEKPVEQEPPKPEPIVEKPKTEAQKIQSKKDVIEAEAMFCKMGLVESLIYWRDPKKSGPIFGGVLLILLSLKFFSLISVVAYVSLLGLAATISFRIYKNIVQAVQKTGDGHPFKDYLETDVALPQQKVEEVTKVAVTHLNATIVELRRLFLVEDLVDSIKFAVLLWCFTYLGAWFNGITLIILAWVALFSLPKVYETNKTQIDANLDIVRSKLAEITSKVKAAVPIGKKSEEKKE